MIVQNMPSRAAQILFAVIVLLCAVFAHSQVTVAIAPDPHPQFLDSKGKPLASGFLYTYQAGTTTFLSTYADSSGTVQNPAIIPLDVSGAPSNGSGVQVGVWLANTAYKFCAYNSALVQQWCTDNVTGFLGLLNLPNVWSFQQTFSLPIIDTATDNQLVFGSAGNQTTVDAPPPTGNVSIHLPNISDTLVGRITTDALQNKTLILPLFNSSGCGPVNGPATYICIANQNPTGTTLNTLTKVVNAPSQAQIASVSAVTGVLGITVAGAGNTGTATIQTSGVVPCVFDGATTAGAAVIASPTVIGNCRSGGNTAVAIGVVLSTNAAGGTYNVLFTGMPPNQPIATDTLNLGSSTITSGTCNTSTITETGTTTLSKVAWAYAGGTPTAPDLKLIVSPEARANQVVWNICNPTAGSLIQSGAAVVNFTVTP